MKGKALHETGLASILRFDYKSIVNLNTTCVAELRPHLQSRNIEDGPVTDGILQVPGLGLEILASDPRHSKNAVFVTFEARALGASSPNPGIRVLAAGSGETVEAACADAASQWVLGVLPVIISFMLRSHVCEIEKTPVIVGVQDSNERYGWTVHLGPVIARAYGTSADKFDEAQLGDLSRSAAFNPVFHAIHPYAAHKSLMWVESFAARYFRDCKVDATCRLNNKDFDEGREASLGWAIEWPDTGVAMLSKRQFLFFESTPVGQLESKTNLLEALETEIRKRSHG
jgi:Family of unknown function (DUF6348)